jgi:hypothetical protein
MIVAHDTVIEKEVRFSPVKDHSRQFDHHVETTPLRLWENLHTTSYPNRRCSN